MPCYHPQKGFIIGLTEAGKKKLKIVPYNVDHIELNRSGNYISETLENVSAYSEKTYRDYVVVPCGKCIGCKLDYSRQWADRCMLEMQYHKHTWFVTLTYDEDHLPRTWYSADQETGEAVMAATLSKRDLQLFFKRLRKNTGQQVRYFCAGEYGDETKRPHYHCIIFGLDLPEDDRTLYKQERGYSYYNSKIIDQAWSYWQRDEKGNEIPNSWSNCGYAVVTECTWETAAYTARYCMKKAFTDQAEFYDNFNLQPEFTQMSRRPGIAYDFYQDHKNHLLEFDYVSISTPKGGRNIRPSKYYDKLFDIDFPEEFAILKEDRKEAAEIAQKNLEKVSGRPWLQNLAEAEAAKLNKIKSLQRKEI